MPDAARVPPTKTILDEPSAAANGTGRFGPSRRLRRPSEFAAVLAAPRSQALRSGRQWLSMTAAWVPSETTGVRFGVTVGKRNARRSVDRVLVKRILREASRRAARGLEATCTSRGLRLDVAFRLKASRDAAAGRSVSLKAWRLALRAEADGLLERLERHVAELVT